MIAEISKLNAWQDDEVINVTQILELFFESRENTMGKGENAGHQHFLLFHTMFLKGIFFRVM